MTWMQNLRDRRERGDRGFTLIELLLVIVILGVLAAVVVLSVQGISDRGEASACGATQTAVLSANEAFFAQSGGNPLNTEELRDSGFMEEGTGALVAGNTVSGTGWSFDFDPATSTVSNPVGCDGSGGGGPGPTTIPDPDPLACGVTNVTGNTVTLGAGGALPSFTILADTDANCAGVTLEVFITGGATDITAALGAATSPQAGWSDGTFDGVIREVGGDTFAEFDLVVSPAAPCTVTSPTGTTQARGNSSTLASFSFGATLANCDGVSLEVFVNRAGTDILVALGSPVTGTQLSSWSVGTYTDAGIRVAGGGAVMLEFDFVVNQCSVSNFEPDDVNVSGNPGDIANNTEFSITVSSGCSGVPLQIFIDRTNSSGRTDIVLNVGSTGTVRSANLTDSSMRNDWFNGLYDVIIRNQTSGYVYVDADDAFDID